MRRIVKMATSIADLLNAYLRYWLYIFILAVFIKIQEHRVWSLEWNCQRALGVADAGAGFWLYSPREILSSGRLHQAAWMEPFTNRADPNDEKPTPATSPQTPLTERQSDAWIQVDVNRARIVTGVQTQGDPDSDEWMTSYSVQHSQDCEIFEHVRGINGRIAMFNGNHDRNNVSTSIFGEPVMARCVRILPITVHSNMTAIRLELLGCNLGMCMESEIQARFSASLTRQDNEIPGGDGFNDRQTFDVKKRQTEERPYIEIMMDTDKIVVGFTLQRIDSNLRWSDTVVIQHSRNCYSWRYIMDSEMPDTLQEFIPYTNISDRVLHVLGSPIRAHCVRILLPHHTNSVSFQAQLLGCETGHPPSPPCRRKRKHRFKRVVGGHPVSEGEWPWLVNFLYLPPGSDVHLQSCAGTLIDRRLVLTAAHCVYGFYYLVMGNVSTNHSDYNRPDFKSRLLVRFGEHHLKSNTGVEFEINITHIYIHPDYYIPYYVNDIALLRLKDPVPYTQHVNIGCLPEADDLAPPGTRCTVAGWGYTEAGYPSVAYQTDIFIVDREICDQMYYHLNITEDMMCAGRSVDGIDACKGDSGGPLMCEIADRWLIVGVVSWNIGCGRKKFPAVYANIFHFLPWIREISDTIHR